MRFTIATAALVGSAAATGYGYPPAPPAYNTTSAVETPSYPAETPSVAPPVYITKTVEEYETYCPGPTEVTQGGKTYTVTEATTLTITDCPCTVVETETPYVPSPTPETPVYPTPEVPAPEVPEVPYPSSNGTAPAPVYPTGTGAVPAPSQPPTEFPGSASQMGVGLLAIVGAVAAFL